MNRIVVVMCLLLMACAPVATRQEFERQISSWVGRNVSDLIVRLGAPTSVYDLPDGRTVYSFTQSSTYTTPTYVTPTRTTPSTTTVQVFDDLAFATTTPSRTTGGQTYGGQTVTKSCTVSFITDQEGRILGWHDRGNDCVSRPPN